MSRTLVSLRRMLLVVGIAVVTGLVSAFFLTALARITQLWDDYPLLLWGLPLAGFLMAAVYRGWGAPAAPGTALIIDAVHDPVAHPVPLRMMPLILGSTLLTHLCGGSAGREGTAVQMAGSIAGAVIRWLRIDTHDARLLMMAAISAGFASVFGTPLAGMVFGMEVLASGAVRMKAALLCLLSALVGDATVRMLGVGHAAYPLLAPSLSPILMGWSVVAGVVFAVVVVVYIELHHAVGVVAQRFLGDARWRTAAGGAVIVVLTSISGTTAYNGLGLPLLTAAFSGQGVPLWAFAYKMLFTAITLGVGFKGGEVTPLFVIGATAGATLGHVIGVPMEVMAALGFVAVFGAATHTPLTCVLLGVELFGAGLLVPVAIAVIVAVACVGKRGVYQTQRVSVLQRELDAALQWQTLQQIRTQRRRFRDD
ncbi:MAG: chloride channel protein [Roseiflexaceae bacterium]